MRRRRLIAATGTVVTALLAGCGSPGGEGEGGEEGGGEGGAGGGDGGGEEGGGEGGDDLAEPAQFGP